MEKPLDPQLPSPHQNLHRNHCHKICHDCLQNLPKDKFICRMCGSLDTIDVGSYCKREMNMWICGPIPILNLKKFQNVFEECYNHIEAKKSSKSFTLKCKLQDNEIASKILQHFGISKEVCIHICYTNLSTTCEVTQVSKRRKIGSPN
jgi:hypothetical protein